MTADDTIEALIAQLASSPRDEGAWRGLYRQLWPYVFSIIFRHLKNKLEAEEAAQEVFLRLVRSNPFSKLDDAAALRAYVWRVSINVVKTQSNRARVLRIKDEAARGALAEQPATYAASRKHDVEDVLSLAEATLRKEDVELLRLLLSGMSLGEAAAELQLTYSLAGVRLHRLKESLRKLLVTQDEKK